MSGPHDDAGRVLVCGFEGTEPPSSVLRWVQDGQLAGVILFKRNLAEPQQVAALTAAIHEGARDAPPLVCVDQEGGRVARLGAPLIQLPAARTLASAGDPRLTQHAAAVLGAQLRALGFNLNFAPVLDVDTNPGNPIIGDRAFGATPQDVILHATAFARGLHEGGVLSCGKHFPGHGDTDVDSHLTLPRIRHTLSRIRDVELAPFVGTKDTLPAMMSAHIVVDALDDTTPATLSPSVMTALLRDEMGFGGVLFSDDLEMKAVSERWSIAESCVLAVAAGCDTLLICSRHEACGEAREALIAESEKSNAFASRLAEARRRTDALRDRTATLPPARPFGETLSDERVVVVERALADLTIV